MGGDDQQLCMTVKKCLANLLMLIVATAIAPMLMIGDHNFAHLLMMIVLQICCPKDALKVAEPEPEPEPVPSPAIHY